MPEWILHHLLNVLIRSIVDSFSTLLPIFGREIYHLLPMCHLRRHSPDVLLARDFIN